MIGRRTWAAACVGIAAVAGVLVTAPAASAAPLQVVIDSCETGASKFICTVSVTGGTAPYTKTWVGIENATITPPGGRGTCTADLNTTVKVKVVDATGIKRNDTSSFECSDGPWP